MSLERGRVLELLGPSAGGIRRHVDVLARHLPDHGWEPLVAGPAGVMDGLDTAAEPVPVALHPTRAVASLQGVRRLVAAHRAQVVHAHGLTAGWLAVLAGTGLPVVVTIHNVVLPESAGRAAPILARLQAALPGRVAATIAVSSAIAGDLAGRGGRSVEVIIPASQAPQVSRPGAEIRSGLGLEQTDPLVVTVARLHPQKGIDHLLAAASALRERIPSVRVAIVGDGPLRDSLASSAKAQGVADVVTFVGEQPDAPSWMAAADVVAVPSTWEGSPLVVAEALRLGRPLVATDVGDVGEVVQDGRTGRLVPPGRPSLLAAALGDMLCEPERAAEMARAGHVVAAERYSVERLVAEVAATYDRVIEKAP